MVGMLTILKLGNFGFLFHDRIDWIYKFGSNPKILVVWFYVFYRKKMKFKFRNGSSPDDSRFIPKRLRFSTSVGANVNFINNWWDIHPVIHWLKYFFLRMYYNWFDFFSVKNNHFCFKNDIYFLDSFSKIDYFKPKQLVCAEIPDPTNFPDHTTPHALIQRKNFHTFLTPHPPPPRAANLKPKT